MSELEELLRAGRLEQICPARCQEGWRRGLDPETTEAAGGYCSACGAPTGPSDWRPAQRSDAQRAVTARATAARTKNGAHRRRAQAVGA